MPPIPMLAIAAMLFPIAATAQDAPAPAPEETPAPAATPDRAAAAFAKIDRNGDGVVTADEWKAAGRRERGFKFIDSDHDGKLTLAELRAAAARFHRGG